ncbi:PhlD [Kitasatospora kifunensis]|uniref:Putative naringenin-chalcone synthase n=1 Tax=Kitasatospora kifunensis TaxID=58351 RepID=A0A7W7R847_KITKI|nr:PhlD [Kitasatospora kifunensis]MBB4927168.1 putative naringenin-chalcone synthase [Kitasatospora kifunensis]
MGPVYVSRPAVVLPPHRIPRQLITDDITSRHRADLTPRRLAAMPKYLAQLPATRHFSRPLAAVLGEWGIEERSEAVVADLVEIGLHAARAAIDAAGLRPVEIDCLITAHVTGFLLPGLDVALHNALGLRPDAACRPTTELGCAGGAYALVAAREYLAAHPGATVLVVAAEILSLALYHHGDITVEQLIYKALWGDGAAAALVTDRPLGPGLRIDGTWEQLLPATTERYRAWLDQAGYHFGSTKEALDSVPEVLPALRAHLAAAGGRLDFVVSHTGGPKILDQLALGLEIDPELLRHARACLDEHGNLGGPSVLAVLERTHTTAPVHGDQGILLGFGPGFRCIVLRGTWWSPPPES